MATTYCGMFGSGDWTVPDERPQDWLTRAFKLWPGSPGTFLLMLQKWGKRTVTDYRYHMFEERLSELRFTIVTGVDATATTLTFDAPTTPTKHMKAGDLLISETTGEVVRVAIDPVAPYTQCVVMRHWGSSAPGQSIADNAIMMLIGDVYGEGTRSPRAIGKGVDVVYNFTQPMVHTAKVSMESEHIESRPYGSWELAQKRAFEQHRIAICQGLYHGVRNLTTDEEGNRLSTTGGVDQFVTTNLWDASGGVSLEDLEDACEDVYTEGASTLKTGICGLRAFNVLNRVVNRNTVSYFELEPAPAKNLTFGLVVRRLNTPSGPIDLVVDPLLTRSAKYTKSVYVIDPMYIQYVTLKGLDTKFKDNVQLPDERSHKGYYHTEFGLSLALQECHAIWSGLDEYQA